jgi:uncharacterized GH25 family protein
LSTLPIVLGLVVAIVVAVIAIRPWSRDAKRDGAEASAAPSAIARPAAPPPRTPAIEVPADAPGWIAQPNAPKRRLAGSVLLDGAPAANVVVRVTSELSAVGLVPVLEQRSDANGRFDFGMQPAREFVVSAAVPQRLAAIEKIDLRAGDRSLILAITSCTVSLYGKVLDAAGGPIAGARILREDAIGAETDAHGNYDLCVPPAAPQREQLLVVARANGYGAISMIVAPSGRTMHDFILTPEATLAGRVIANERPVAHAKIVVEPDDAIGRYDEQPATTIAITDERGAFRITGLAGGRHRVAAFGRGVRAPPTVVVVEPGETKDVTLAARGEAIVRGRVLHAGQPVAGARVAIATKTHDASADSAVSQADGSFVLDRAPLGSVTFTTAPFRAPVKSFELAPGDNEIVLDVAPLAVVRGTLRHGKAPAALGRITLLGPTRIAAAADATGNFEVPGLEPGDYTIYAWTAARDAYVVDRKLSVTLGETRLDLDLIAGARFTGVVVDREARPVRGAYVAFYNNTNEGRCITDERGAFACTGFGPGTFDVSILSSASGGIELPIVDGKPTSLVSQEGKHVDGLRFVVGADDRRSIAGRVLDPAGAPIPDVTLRAMGNAYEGGAWMPLPKAVTNLDGAFQIANLAAGTYSLVAHMPDGSKAIRHDIAAGARDVTITVGPACAPPPPRDPKSKPASRVAWANSIELVGWDAPKAVAIGERFDVTLYFRVLRPLDRTWKIFVHAESGKQRANFDHDPAEGRCPTSLWKPGDLVVDRVAARFTDIHEPGRYTLWIGFFVGVAGRWQNLDVEAADRDANDRIPLATIEAR